MNNSKQAATAEAASNGIGFFGMLIIIGLLGFGPCSDSCSGCGPTVKSVLQEVKCEGSNH